MGQLVRKYAWRVWIVRVLRSQLAKVNSILKELHAAGIGDLGPSTGCLGIGERRTDIGRYTTLLLAVVARAV